MVHRPSSKADGDLSLCPKTPLARSCPSALLLARAATDVPKGRPSWTLSMHSRPLAHPVQWSGLYHLGPRRTRHPHPLPPPLPPYPLQLCSAPSPLAASLCLLVDPLTPAARLALGYRMPRSAPEKEYDAARPRSSRRRARLYARLRFRAPATHPSHAQAAQSTSRQRPRFRLELLSISTATKSSL